MWFKGFGLYTRCNPDLFDHVQVSIGQGGGLQLQIVELEQADLQLGESSRSKKLSRLFLGHFWTKIRSDNCFEIVLTYRMA